jgi:imidazolonepropionase-like amidohydrolase
VTKAIIGGTVFDATGAPPLADGVVIIEGERISAVGPRAQVSPGAEIISAEGMYVLPGLIDAHQHLGHWDPMEPGIDFNEAWERTRRDEPSNYELLLLSVRHGRHELRNGVTTLRILGEKGFIDAEYRRAFDADVVPGPRVLISGPGLTTSHGHGREAGVVVDGVDEVRRAVRTNIRAGADWIKLFATGGGSTAPLTCFFSLEEIRTAIAEAHEAGKKVAAHAMGGKVIRQLVEAGVDSIEHGGYLTDEDVQLIRERGVWLVFTNSWYFHDAYIQRFPFGDSRAIAREQVQKAYNAGLKIAVGADCFHYDHSLAWEIELLVRCGVSPKDALLMATKNGAELCGLQDKIGTLEAGKQADIILVAGNPLADIRALREIRLVIKAGKIYDLPDAVRA